jgi:hypothetical protein
MMMGAWIGTAQRMARHGGRLLVDRRESSESETESSRARCFIGLASCAVVRSIDDARLALQTRGIPTREAKGER